MIRWKEKKNTNVRQQALPCPALFWFNFQSAAKGLRSLAGHSSKSVIQSPLKSTELLNGLLGFNAQLFPLR